MELSIVLWRHDPLQSCQSLRRYCSETLSNLSRKLWKPVAQVVSERARTGQQLKELIGINRSLGKRNPSRTFVTYSRLPYVQLFRYFTYGISKLHLVFPNITTDREYLLDRIRQLRTCSSDSVARKNACFERQSDWGFQCLIS